MAAQLNRGLRSGGSLVWLYLLIAVPFLTDLGETGRLPASPRDWLSEIVGGLVIAALVRKVRQEHLAVQRLARTDALTGLLNRGSFESVVQVERARALRYGRPLSLVYFDLDRFKQLNDRFGHRAGDLALQQFAVAMSGAIRNGIDRGFRLGGDEFALLLPDTSAGEAKLVAARVRERCLATGGYWVADGLDTSIGVVEYESPESAGDFVHRADAAMYRVKLALRRQSAASAVPQA